MIMSGHRRTLNGGVASTVAAVRSLFWIPVLRKLTRSVIRYCMVVKDSEPRIIQIQNQGSYER